MDLVLKKPVSFNKALIAGLCGSILNLSALSAAWAAPPAVAEAQTGGVSQTGSVSQTTTSGAQPVNRPRIGLALGGGG